MKAVPENLLQPLTTIANKIVKLCPAGWYKLELEAKRQFDVVLVKVSATSRKSTEPIQINEHLRSDVQNLMDNNRFKHAVINSLVLTVASSGDYQLDLK